MRRALTGAIFATALVASPAAAEQFDLVCVGTFREIVGATPGSKPWRDRIRIDKGAMMWCREKCDRLFPIKRITVSEYVLIDVSDPAEMHLSINRRTGEFRETFDVPPPLHTSTGTSAVCTKAAFSGFPPAKF